MVPRGREDNEWSGGHRVAGRRAAKKAPVTGKERVAVTAVGWTAILIIPTKVSLFNINNISCQFSLFIMVVGSLAWRMPYQL